MSKYSGMTCQQLADIGHAQWTQYGGRVNKEIIDLIHSGAMVAGGTPNGTDPDADVCRAEEHNFYNNPGVSPVNGDPTPGGVITGSIDDTGGQAKTNPYAGQQKYASPTYWGPNSAGAPGVKDLPLGLNGAYNPLSTGIDAGTGGVGDIGGGAPGDTGIGGAPVGTKPFTPALDYPASATGYLTGKGGWADRAGLTIENTDPNATFDPLSSQGSLQLASLYNDQMGRPDWRSNQDQPFLESQFNLLPFMTPGSTAPTNLDMAAMTPDILNAVNTPGQAFNAGKAYDQIVGGDWGNSLAATDPNNPNSSLLAMDPATQQATLLSGIQALAPYYSSQTLANTANMVKRVSDRWVRQSQTDPAFAAQYPTITSYLRAMGADNWM